MSRFTPKVEDARLASSTFSSLSGISLKPAYYQGILADRPEVGFFEIHAENYLSNGGPARHYLHKIREHYPLTVHGVGLSIGGETPLNIEHLKRVAKLVNELQPAIFSEHLAWSTHHSQFLNDLLPVPYDGPTLDRVCRHIEQVQECLQRQILLENPSTYFEFTRSDMSETDFIREIAKRTGCGLLLDVNNVEVSCFNNRTNPYDYLNDFPLNAVGQMHLAGHTIDSNTTLPLKIDSHDEPVSHDVWALYQYTCLQLNMMNQACPTLIERDGNLPPLTELLAEARYADTIRQTALRESRYEQRI
ncbi:DUF692 domain-containing protein [Marinomonas arenicola]|uniref:MNIO family bufferin maturase n=1 Tax=Marinomonas arenicola TaxID=569601 RepID=UPI00311F3E7C